MSCFLYVTSPDPSPSASGLAQLSKQSCLDLPWFGVRMAKLIPWVCFVTAGEDWWLMFFSHFFKAQSRNETEGFRLVMCLNCFAVQSNTAHSSSQLRDAVFSIASSGSSCGTVTEEISGFMAPVLSGAEMQHRDSCSLQQGQGWLCSFPLERLMGSVFFQYNLLWSSSKSKIKRNPLLVQVWFQDTSGSRKKYAWLSLFYLLSVVPFQDQLFMETHHSRFYK